MPVCSYLVLPEPGGAHSLSRRLAALPGCDVTRADNRNLLLLVTDTPSPEKDRELRDVLREMEGIHALILTFGEIDPETEEADPVGASRKQRDPSATTMGRSRSRKPPWSGRSEARTRSLPVIDPGNLGHLQEVAREKDRDASASSPSSASGKRDA